MGYDGMGLFVDLLDIHACNQYLSRASVGNRYKSLKIQDVLGQFLTNRA